jgi:WD40 repeat protein
VATGKELGSFTGHQGSITGLSFSPDGRRALSLGEDLTVRLWDLGDLPPPANRPAEQKMAAGEVPTRQELKHWDLKTRPMAGGVTRDNRRGLVSAGPTLFMLDLDGKQDFKPLQAHERSITALALLPDGRRAITAAEDKILRLWDLNSGQKIREFKGHTGRINGVGIFAEGRKLFTCSGELVIENGRGKEKDGKPVYEDVSIRVWDVETGKETGRFGSYQTPVHLYGLSADGTRAFLEGDGFKGRALWDPNTGTEVRSIEFPGISGFPSMSKDGRQALFCKSDQEMRVWDLENDIEISCFETPLGGITSIAFSPDGRYFVVGGSKGKICLCEKSTGHKLCFFEGHYSHVWGMVFTSDGRRLLSYADDYTARLWDLTGVMKPAGPK